MSSLTFANGDTMPQLGLGTWLSGPGETYRAVREAIRCGYRHIDCARAYGNEAEVGHALQDEFAGGLNRNDLWVTSKLWNNAHFPDRVRPTLEQTLKDLQLDHVDLYLMHWPIAQREGAGDPPGADDLVHPDELPFERTWAAMQWCVESGRARHIGVANFSPRKLERLLSGAGVKPEVNQVELHPYLQQAALVEYCHDHGIHVTAYSPLGSGGRPEHLKVTGEPVLLEDPTLQRIADRHGASVAQIIVAWAVQRGISTIPKSVHSVRIRENLGGVQIALTDDDMDEIRRLDRHRRYNPGIAFTLADTGYTYEWLWDEAPRRVD